MYNMNTSVLLWFVQAVACLCTCFTWAVPLGREQHHYTGWSLWYNRAKRDVRMTNHPSAFSTVRPRHTFQRWTTRPAGQTWVPLTGTVNNNLTEKEIFNRQNKTKWNFSRYPTVNRFYSTLPYIRATGSPVIQLNDTNQLASNHHYNGSRASTTKRNLGWGHSTAEPISPTSVAQSSKLSSEERYTIVIAVLSAVLLLTLLGFLAHCHRVRKRRKVVSITLA